MEASKDLLQGLLKGDTWAYKQLEKQTFPHHLNLLKGDKDLAWDLYQEAIIEVLKILRQRDFIIPTTGGEKVVLSLMRQYLDWKRLDYWKSSNSKYTRGLEGNNSLFESSINPEEELRIKMLLKALDEILEKMSDKCRSLIEMKTMEGMKWNEIYPVFNAKTESQKTRLRQDLVNCLRVLRAKLNDFRN
ncbi:hypothetical protein [Runella sp.]|uniref:RNA polymerase sigma factor n=1 Tax=Runella sp. TaxID=1960881 RepID=UPI0030168A24